MGQTIQFSGEVDPVMELYELDGQLIQEVAPYWELYVPTGHVVHFNALVSPIEEPYDPGGHKPLQVLVVNPCELP